MEEGKNLEGILEELHGVWERNVIKADAGNKRDLRRAIVHTYREVCYKPQGEGQTDTDGEVGGGHITVEGRDNTTRREERASTFIGTAGR